MQLISLQNLFRFQAKGAKNNAGDQSQRQQRRLMEQHFLLLLQALLLRKVLFIFQLPAIIGLRMKSILFFFKNIVF